VADYLDMLALELRGESYSKAEHRRHLLPLLRGRTEGAIERKHGNISAVLIELGLPYISGYKPYGNYQRLLLDTVAARLDAAPEVERLVEIDVASEVHAPSVDDILAAYDVAAPVQGRRDHVKEAPADNLPSTRPRKVDYLRREAENRSLGLAGEEFVVRYERARLTAAGQESLAARIEHISSTRGDGDGYDVLSYEASGRERLIEVKTTKYGSLTPFFVSRNELDVSERRSEQYHLYRVYSFRKGPRLFSVSGSLSARFRLAATQYVARIE